MYYFAYGSNILQERLENRVGKVIKVENGILKNSKLIFNCANTNTRTPFANVVSSKKDTVHGVIYKINRLQLLHLDYFEGFYYRKEVKINNKKCWCYFAYNEFSLPKEGIPDFFYLNLILDGCLQQGLNELYNKLLNFKLKSFKLSINNSRHKFL